MTLRGDIDNVLNRYALAYDTNDMDEMKSVFTEDATFSMRIQGGDLIGPFEGRDAIMKLMTDSLASQTDQRRHVTTNLVIREQSDSRVVAQVYLTLISVADGALTVLSSGLYTDELVQEDGEWRLKKLHLDLDLPY